MFNFALFSFSAFANAASILALVLAKRFLISAIFFYFSAFSFASFSAANLFLSLSFYNSSCFFFSANSY